MGTYFKQVLKCYDFLVSLNFFQILQQTILGAKFVKEIKFDI
jgi:hypothetical protein